MPITAQYIKIAIKGDYLGEEWQMVQWYEPSGAAFLTADARGVGEAYWNDVKTALRATVPANANLGGFRSIFVSEPGANGAYGEFPVPGAEQVGTRSTAGLGDQMPPFVAAGVRLTVATRVTRPGQKRFPFINEVDNVNGVLQSALAGVIATAAAKFSTVITLGAPVATGTLQPVIVRLDVTGHTVLAAQDVTGYLVATNITTQNSRKAGRGA